ncbi:MAG: beta-ketoacyl-ACP synthase II [Planctomycetota bacterium]|nr:beta-ketoacyl-ACP synthase II [Planctomycetota bacterium]
MGARRVVVTGLGTVNACGNDVDTAWKAVLGGVSGITNITRFDARAFEMPCDVAGELKNFDAAKWIAPKDHKKLDLMTMYGIAATEMAWDDAGLARDGTGLDLEVCGTILGTGIGGLDTIEDTHTTIMEKGHQRVSPYFVPKMMANAIAGNVSIRFGLQGPSYITSSACASANHAMALAMRSVRDGEQDLCVTGGAEATITTMGMAGFNSMRAMSRRNDEPTKASRPFDRNRDGFVMGEGAGILIFEELEHAKRRGARIYCEILGAGMSADAYHITAPAPGGVGPRRAMMLALRDAKINLDQVDYINAHGTSTSLNDAAETAAVKAEFGEYAYKLAISSSKSLVGHLLGGSGGVEAVFTAKSIETGQVHPTINQDEADPECDLDYVPNVARDLKIRYALSNSLGFGGHNVTLAFGAFTD